MRVERKNNQLLIYLSDDIGASRIQDILDYIKYVELTSTSTVTQNEVTNLVKLGKKGRWARTKKSLGLHAQNSNWYQYWI